MDMCVSTVCDYLVIRLSHYLRYAPLLNHYVTQQHTGSWAFSASQLDLAENEIQDCNNIIEELTTEIADRDDELEQLDR